MKLISWNIQRAKGKRIQRQIGELRCHEPDIVALQEILPESFDVYQQALSDAGLICQQYSLARKAVDKETGRKNRSGVLIASRWSVTEILSSMTPGTWRHKFLSTKIDIEDFGEIEVHTAHIPPGSQYGRRKIDAMKAIYEALAIRSSRPRILCGDFNAPQRELPDGTIVTWGQRIRKDKTVIVRPDRGEEWIKAEWDILKGLAIWDLRDVYRRRHGCVKEEYSWYWNGKIGRRYDHIFSSDVLIPVSCKYLEKLRLGGLSDHAPIEAVFKR